MTWFLAYGQLDLKDCTFKIQDGGANEVEIVIGAGNMTWTERKNIEYQPDRGSLDEVREGDEAPLEVQFDFTWEYLEGPSSDSTASGGTPTIEDALKQKGAAASWVSSDADTCRPYSVDLEVTYEPNPSDCGDKETYLFPDFRHEELSHSFREGTVSCSGHCNVTEPTITRAAQ